MKFLTLAVLALVTLTRGQGIQNKRGLAASQQAYSAQAPATALAYTKVQQPVQKTVVAASPQPQFYTQQAAAPSAYALPVQQQYQYQPQAQAVAYAQPTLTKYAAAPAPAVDAVGKVAAYRQPFSLANDVSSFTYSSPVVQYNNLGLLSQVVGKFASAPVQAKTAPAPAVYQAQAAPAPQQFAYAAAPVAQKYALPAQTQRYVAAPQQYLAQAPQQQYVSVPASQAQAYSAQALQAAAQASQAYTAQGAQSIPQSFYAQAPQYYTNQQVKQGNPGVAYAQ